jgi:hypothetical protein
VQAHPQCINLARPCRRGGVAQKSDPRDFHGGLCMSAGPLLEEPAVTQAPLWAKGRHQCVFLI